MDLGVYQPICVDEIDDQGDESIQIFPCRDPGALTLIYLS